MATVSEIKSALDSLGGGNAIDKNAVLKEVLKKNLSLSYGDNIAPEKIEEMANDIIAVGKASICSQVEAIVNDLNAAISTLPSMIAELPAQISSITLTVVGPAAPAAEPMIASLMSQITALKSQLSSLLSKALELGVDVPGIDPLIAAAKTIGAIV